MGMQNVKKLEKQGASSGKTKQRCWISDCGVLGAPVAAAPSPSGGKCFFDITIGGAPAGRITFNLFDDVTPRTCANFRALCRGDSNKRKKITLQRFWISSCN